jgi:SPP1 gp7 family putative phage head morphogenesis protein
MNDEAKLLVENWLAIQRYGNGVSAEFQKLLDRRLIEVRKILDEDDYAKRVRAIDSELRAALTAEGVTLYAAAGGVLMRSEAAFYGFAEVTVSEAMVKRALATPMPNSKITPNQLMQRTVGTITQKTVNSITDARNQGLTNRQLRNILARNHQADVKAMDKVARTSMNAVANRVKQELYNKNDGIVRGVLWNSVLDSRTSDFCMLHDGLIFPLDRGPRPPAHPNCRSQIVPVLDNESNQAALRSIGPRPSVVPRSKNFTEKDAFTRTGKKRKPGKKSPLVGKQVNNTTYATWLKDQPAAYQNVILGQSGGKQFRSGANLKKVITDRNNTLDLSGLNTAIN